MSKETDREHKLAYYRRNKEKLYAQAQHRLQTDDNARLRRLEYMVAYRFRLRCEVLSHYGQACACCGEDDMRFLTLDHIHGDGAEDRRRNGGGGFAMYLRVRKQGYPAGFQVLCHNCNQAKGRFGSCPHEFGANQMDSLLYQTRVAWAHGNVLPFDKKRDGVKTA